MNFSKRFLTTNLSIILNLHKNIFGKLYGDKGYTAKNCLKSCLLMGFI